VGAWGQIPMPAIPQVSEAEAATLAKWVLSVK
jgi:cytochrome c